MIRVMRATLGLMLAMMLAIFGMASLSVQPAHADATKIASFEVEGVTPPVANMAFKTGFSGVAIEGCSWSSAGRWYVSDKEAGSYLEIGNLVTSPKNKSCDEGKYYTFVATLTLGTGYEVSSSATATVNGVKAHVEVEGSYIYIWRTFYCEFGTSIDETNFPDDIFRSYVQEKFDANSNDILSTGEAEEVTEISIANKAALKSLEGIELFPKLEKLYCYNTSINSLNLSGNPALEVLECFDTNITSLDVSNNPALALLNCSYTSITSLDVSKNPVLGNLDCYGTKITTLDVSRNPALVLLDCSDTLISSLDVSKNSALGQLDCSGTNISFLDLSGNTTLSQLWCNDCPKLSSVFLGRKASFELGNGVTVIESPLALEAVAVKLASTSLVYTGKALKPAVTVTGYAGAKLVAGTDYTVSYKSNKAVGTATVTVTGKGSYKETVTKTFTIVPAAPKAASPKAGKKSLTAKWKKAAGAAGYQVSYSTSKKFAKKSTKTAKVKGAKAVSKKLTKLKGGKRYYVKVRAFKVVNGKTYCSAWSSVKSAKTKK